MENNSQKNPMSKQKAGWKYIALLIGISLIAGLITGFAIGAWGYNPRYYTTSEIYGDVTTIKTFERGTNRQVYEKINLSGETSGSMEGPTDAFGEHHGRWRLSKNKFDRVETWFWHGNQVDESKFFRRLDER